MRAGDPSPLRSSSSRPRLGPSKYLISRSACLRSRLFSPEQMHLNNGSMVEPSHSCEGSDTALRWADGSRSDGRKKLQQQSGGRRRRKKISFQNRPLCVDLLISLEKSYFSWQGDTLLFVASSVRQHQPHGCERNLRDNIETTLGCVYYSFVTY